MFIDRVFLKRIWEFAKILQQQFDIDKITSM